MRGKLFTQDYLRHPNGGITGISAWRELQTSHLAATEARLGEIFGVFLVTGIPTEAGTRLDLKRRHFLAERGLA